MRMLISKQTLHFSRSAFINENIHNKNCPHLVLCLNASGDRWHVFRIWLDLRWSTIEPCLWKLCNSPRSAPNSFMVFTLSINIVLFRIWRSPRLCGDGRNPIILNQYGEQLCIRHWKWMVHFSPFPFLALVKAWVKPLIVFLCEPLGRLETGKGDLDIP